MGLDYTSLKLIQKNFEKIAKEDFIKFHKTENSDSLEKSLQKKFPAIFKKENDCCIALSVNIEKRKFM